MIAFFLLLQGCAPISEEDCSENPADLGLPEQPTYIDNGDFEDMPDSEESDQNSTTYSALQFQSSDSQITNLSYYIQSSIGRYIGSSSGYFALITNDAEKFEQTNSNHILVSTDRYQTCVNTTQTSLAISFNVEENDADFLYKDWFSPYLWCTSSTLQNEWPDSFSCALIQLPSDFASEEGYDVVTQLSYNYSGDAYGASFSMSQK